MPRIEQLHERLLAAASLLDAAAGEVRDIKLEPASANVRHIGNALAEIYEILRSIYAVRPDLTPAELEVPRDESGANKRLTVALGEAYGLVGDNRLAEAVALLNRFCDGEASEFHREIAKHELQRLEKRER